VTDDRRLLELLPADAPQREKLARYGALVLAANRQFNVTGAKSADDFAPHLIDSISIAAYVGENLLDIGSGGGLPAIPLALVTGVPVTLVETTLKKARFLERMLAEFDLRGEVVPLRAEVAAHDERWRGRFHTGTARAVSSAPTVAELLLPFLAVGGSAVMQRGTMDARESQALADAALMLGGKLDRIEVLDTDPLRQVAIVRKLSETNPRFPRRTGIPEKRPLCL
jgi:16S rRNA (guanine527-N7)-methyltransferase